MQKNKLFIFWPSALSARLKIFILQLTNYS